MDAVDQTLLTVAYWLIVRRFVTYRPPEPVYGPGLALAVSGLIAWPWLRMGAFGSALDVLLALAAGTAFGYLAWSILLAGWIPAQRRDPRRPRHDRFTGGLVAGVTVLLLASAYSFDGVQLLLMTVLSAAAWAALATGAPGRAYAVIAATVLALVDPDGMHLALMDPLLLAYLGATSLAVAHRLAAGRGRRCPANPAPGGRFSYGGALALGLVAVGIAVWGFAHPGYYGDRLFVILKDQADVTSVASAARPDRTAHRGLHCAHDPRRDDADRPARRARPARDRLYTVLPGQRARSASRLAAGVVAADPARRGPRAAQPAAAPDRHRPARTGPRRRDASAKPVESASHRCGPGPRRAWHRRDGRGRRPVRFRRERRPSGVGRILSREDHRQQRLQLVRPVERIEGPGRF